MAERTPERRPVQVRLVAGSGLRSSTLTSWRSMSWPC
jgi:hypothetical protein